MPVPLSISDFKMFQAVCELRYENAYLIYDRTGLIFHQIRDHFTDIRVTGALPNQSTFQSDEGALGLELSQCRFTTNEPDAKLETFAAHCNQFFDTVTECLDIKVFKRVGLRVFFRKEFKNREESQAALNSLRLINLEPSVRFGAAAEPAEALLRWEGNQVGALLRFKAETGTIDLVLPPELEALSPKIHKDINGLLVDVDYYTVAPVERAQWNASAWIPQSIRTVKKEIDAILGR